MIDADQFAKIGKNIAYLLRPLLAAGRDLLPILLVILVFQLLVFQKPIPHFHAMLWGLLWILLGLALFVRGLELGLFPIGEMMARAFVKKANAAWLLLFAFLMGFTSTIAEPALIAIAQKAAEAAANTGMIEHQKSALQSYAWTLRLVVAVSVGVAIVVGVLRILLGWSLPAFILSGYVLVLCLSGFAPESIIGIAYDSGGVTTSTITVPLVTALGIGLASAIKGRNPVLDGFGLIAFASLLPIIFVMIYGIVQAYNT